MLTLVTDKPAVREYQIYTRPHGEHKNYYWSKPITAETARQAVRIAETLGEYQKNQIRIVKVVATGELLEIPPLD